MSGEAFCPHCGKPMAKRIFPTAGGGWVMRFVCDCGYAAPETEFSCGTETGRKDYAESE